MQYFAHCPPCELTVLAIALFAIWVAYKIATYTPKRRWGENYSDAKYGRKS